MKTSRAFSLSCPFGDGEDCPNTLTGTVNPGTPRTFEDPGDPAEIEDVTGCSHVDDVFKDELKYEELMERVAELEHQSYQDHIDREIDQFLGK